MSSVHEPISPVVYGNGRQNSKGVYNQDVIKGLITIYHTNVGHALVDVMYAPDQPYLDFNGPPLTMSHVSDTGTHQGIFQ